MDAIVTEGLYYQTSPTTSVVGPPIVEIEDTSTDQIPPPRIVKAEDTGTP